MLAYGGMHTRMHTRMQTQRYNDDDDIDINLSIEKGKFVALLGKNGAGKSTLLRTISKVQKPLNGSVFINNKNLNR